MASAINAASGPGIPLEVLRIFTPLGIRFWDLTFDLPINDGLTVNLRLMNSQGPSLTAVLTLSGVYAFFGLPGLHAAEHRRHFALRSPIMLKREVEQLLASKF